MIKNGSTIDGISLQELTFSSKKIVVRVCDLCYEEKEVQWNDVARCRKKHNRTDDYCFKCSMKVYNTGDNNPSKLIENRKKISDAAIGKSKTFKDGKNHRILGRKIQTNGSILKWVEEEKVYASEHRLILAEKLGIHHSKLDEVHHINGDNTDNAVENLIELSGSEHASAHGQIEKLALELVRKNIIVFDKVDKKYYLAPTFDLSLMETSYGFEDIAIKQKKNICYSRLDTDISSEFVRGIKLDIPLIASNMSTVTNAEFYINLYKLGALAILHRADNESNIINEIVTVSKQCDIVAASIGIDDTQFEFAKKMINAGANILTIDIAHGFSDKVLDFAKQLKKYSSNIKIIIGNTTNPDIIYECFHFADAIKVGIAQGLACETKNTAGCTEKQFSVIRKFRHVANNFGIPIISDGGIREPADFTKAMAAGASSVMAGSIFAACPESAAEVVTSNGVEKKLYAGMASEYVQNKWKGKLKPGTCAEGGIRLLDISEPVMKLLERYSGALRSGITYAGANNIRTLQKNVEFVRVTR